MNISLYLYVFGLLHIPALCFSPAYKLDRSNDAWYPNQNDIDNQNQNIFRRKMKRSSNGEYDEINTLVSNSSSTSPPINSCYELNIKIPVIGRQKFRLVILSKTEAQLIIEGVLFINDVVTYKINERTGELSFQLSNESERVLRKFRTTIVAASYCGKDDIPSIVVRPPLPRNINLQLKRKKNIEDQI